MAEPVSSRRDRIIADIVARTGIDEAMIERLVDAFYQRVRADPVLAPVFEPRIADWPAHLNKMYRFWSSVVLMSGAYHGQVMDRHLSLPVDARHFDRWLELFASCAHELCPPPAARHFIERSQWMARSLERGIAARRGVMLARGERYHRDTAREH